MIFTLLFTIFGGGIVYFIQLFFYKKGIGLSNYHLITGGVNVVLPVVFLIIYYLSPELYSGNYELTNSILYFLFSVIAFYYYIFLSSISFGNALWLYKNRSSSYGRLVYLYIISIVFFLLSLSLFL